MFKIISVLLFTFLIFIQNNFSQNYSGGGVLLYSQTAPVSAPIIWSQDFGPGYEALDTQIADDFTSTGSWLIDQIVVMGAFDNDGIIASGFNVYFYSDFNNKPGDLIYFGALQQFTQNINSGNSIIFTITLETPAALNTGDYWISVQACLYWPPSWEMWYWNQIGSNYNRMAEFKNPGGFWPQGCLNWTPIQNCYSNTLTDQYFELYGSSVVPVELTSFSVTINDNNVELSWITSTETNNQGFEIERSSDGEFETIGYVEGQGTTTETQIYSYTDRNVVSGLYKYRLKQIDYDGTFEYSKIVEVNVTSPATFSLEQNYPNPFNPSTVISYQLPVSGNVSLKVFDILGNEVATLVNEEKSAGSYEVEFKAEGLTSGIYFYTLQAGSFVESKKMILLR